MRLFIVSFLIAAFCFISACSLPPERPFTKEQLYSTGIYNYYTLNDSPESVLAELNKKGEAILDARYRNRAVWLKLLGKQSGITVTVIEQ